MKAEIGKILTVFSIAAVIAAALIVYGKGDKDTLNINSSSASAVSPATPLSDLFKISALSDGNYEVFRRFTLKGTTVTCYAVINDKKNKELFHTCTFTVANQPKV